MTSQMMNSRASNPCTPVLRWGMAVALLGAFAQANVSSPSSVAPATSQAQAPAIERYVVAGSTGASLYNLPDPKGHVVLKAAAGTPLAVYGTKVEGRYLKVAAPGGLEVWVFGKYLKQSERLGWYELTGSYVNMRPQPRSQNSYPLGQLDKGDRLLLIKRNDPSKPLAEDWVQVYSPSSTAAYVLAAETTALAAGADGGKLWAAAAETTLATRTAGAQASVKEASSAAGDAAGVTTAVVAAEDAGQEGAPADVFEAMRRADTLMDAEMEKPSPDFLAMVAAYETVLAMNPDAPTRHLVNQRMNHISLAKEFALLERQAALESETRERELRELRDRIAQLSTERDPLWGRFVARGWLETETIKGEKIYRIRFGSEKVAEVQCLSGRYDLAQFANFEIGVKGMPIGNSNRDLDSLPVIDIDRIEVISARLSR